CPTLFRSELTPPTVLPRTPLPAFVWHNHGVLGPYRKIFAYPGALQFSIAGVLARFPISMVTISIVLLTSEVYGAYTVAGVTAAIYTISQSLCAPLLAKLVDRYGQARVKRPFLTVAMTCITVIVPSAELHWLHEWDYLVES